jgi:7-cyano-7-deazaguanine synthase
VDEDDARERGIDPVKLNKWRSVVVLLSGGVDSITLAAMAKSEAKLHSCVFVDYGQPTAQQEEVHASSWCYKNEVPIKIFHCPLDTSELQIGIAAQGPRVVPGRNAVILSLAVHWAAGQGVGNVWIGANWDDRHDYLDCTVGFLHRMSRACHHAYDVRIAAPFCGSDKKNIFETARDLGVNLDNTWSCYEPLENGDQCGLCCSCVEHREGRQAWREK